MAQFREALATIVPLRLQKRSESPMYPRFQVREHTRGLAESEMAAPSDQVWCQRLDHLLETEFRVRPVNSRTDFLNLR